MPVADGVLVGLAELGVGLSAALVGLEDGVPPEVQRAPRWHDRPFRAPVEDPHLAARPRAQREDALRVRRLVLEARQHLVQPVVAALLQEPVGDK